MTGCDTIFSESTASHASSVVGSHPGVRLASRRDIPRSLYSETISDEHEEMRHQQRLTDKTHQQTAQSEYEQRVGLGTHETEDKENGEAHDTHHLLSTDAHQFIEERRESRHSTASRSGHTRN